MDLTRSEKNFIEMNLHLLHFNSSSLPKKTDSMLSRKFNWKDRDKDLNKIAVWSYFKGAKRDPGVDEGATTVAYVPNKGWFWYIPQHSDILSVGVVGEPGYLYRDTRDPDEIFAREVRACSW